MNLEALKLIQSHKLKNNESKKLSEKLSEESYNLMINNEPSEMPDTEDTEFEEKLEKYSKESGLPVFDVRQDAKGLLKIITEYLGEK